MGKIKLIHYFLYLFLLSTSLTFAEDKKFIVGISLPLTGALAEYGDAVQKGILLAKEDFPERFKNIKFIFEDDGYISQKTLGNYQKLIKVQKANLFYAWGTEVSLTISQIANNDGTATLLACLDSRCSKDKEHIIRLFPDFSKLAQPYVTSSIFKSATIIKSESSFFNGQTEFLKKSLPENIKRIENVLPTDTDLSPSVLRIKDDNYDMIGMYLFTPQIKLFLNTLKTYKLKPKIFATTPLFNKQLISEYKEILQDAYLTHFNIKREFVEKYYNRYKKDDQVVYAGAAYENALVIADTFKTNSENLYGIDVIKKLKTSLGSLKDSPNGEYIMKHSSEDSWYLDIPTAMYQIEGEEIIKK